VIGCQGDGGFGRRGVVCRGLVDRPASPAHDDYARRAAPPQKREAGEASAASSMRPAVTPFEALSPFRQRHIGPGTEGPTAHSDEQQGPLDRATQVKAS
jgi:hypothetical protein